MKKSLVAVSIIAVLGTAWSGASWYTGKLIEQRMETLVANTNQQLKEYLPDAGVRLSVENYRRGIFTSQVRYVLHNEDPSMQINGDKVASLVKIDHGPLPLSQVTRLNLLPAMASLHAELENTAALKTLFDLTKGKSPITSDTRITFNGDISSVVDVLPLNHEQSEYRLTFSGAKLTADISHDLKNVRLDFNTDNLEIADKHQGKIVLHGVTCQSDTKKNPLNFNLGAQFLRVKQLQVVGDAQDVLVEGFTMASQTDDKDDYLNGQFDYGVSALKIHGNDLGSGQLKLKVNNVDAKAVKAFIDFYNQQSLNLLQQYEATQQQLAKLVEQNMPRLLKGYPTLSIAPMSWKNSQGEATFTFNLDLQELLPPGTVAAPLDQQLTQAIKRLEGHLTIPESMATESAAQLAQLQGASTQQAQAMAPQQVQGLVAMAQKFNLVTQQDGVIGGNFHYADNQVELNGNKMSLQAFIGGFTGSAPVIEAAPEQPAQCH
ncbi:YdgA family protein [Serratia fonticola]|uniref:YdgA family protein n=1 Tax=Serratia fonticola TaxID=47917 RepID=UPI001AE63F99|nr:YdgA family protein [Serratia fonticola]MBP0996106.1 YdgA family protein [Serratia fonticola]MBP1003379.1 YdgA family protein [Serratia fonticola]